MSELTLFLIRVAYLAILWIFVLSAISVIRSDMFGARVPEAARGATQGRKAAKPAKAPTKLLLEGHVLPTGDVRRHVHHASDWVDGCRHAGPNRGDLRKVQACHLRGFTHGSGHAIDDVDPTDPPRDNLCAAHNRAVWREDSQIGRAHV